MCDKQNILDLGIYQDLLLPSEAGFAGFRDLSGLFSDDAFLVTEKRWVSLGSLCLKCPTKFEGFYGEYGCFSKFRSTQPTMP